VEGLAEDSLEVLELFIEEAWGVGFEVEQEEGVGGTLADVEPPVGGFDGEAVEVVGLGLAVGLGDFSDFCVLILDMEGDFAGVGVASEGGDELAEGRLLAGEDGEEASEGDGGGVGVEVIAEVEAAGGFAAEDGRGVIHGLADGGIGGALSEGGAAGGFGFFADDSAAAEVVDDGGAFVGGEGEEVAGEEGGDEVGGDGVAGFGEEDAAVGIGIEADAEVRGGLGDGGFEEVEVGLVERAGVAGEGAGDFEGDGDDFEGGGVVEDGGDHFGSDSGASVNGDAEFAAEGEESEDVLPVGLPEVFGFEFTGDAGLADAEGGGDAADVFEACGGCDRAGVGAGDSEAIGIDGAMGAGGLDAGDAGFVVDGEVEEGGIDGAEVDDGDAGGAEAFDEGSLKLG